MHTRLQKTLLKCRIQSVDLERAQEILHPIHYPGDPYWWSMDHTLSSQDQEGQVVDSTRATPPGFQAQELQEV